MPFGQTRSQFPKMWVRGRNSQSGYYRHSGNGKHSKPNRGTGALPRQAILLLVVYGLFAAANALSGAFVNVYLWKESHNFALIGGFSLAHYTVHALTFFVAGKWVKEHNKMISLRFGIAISAVFYLLVLLLKSSAIDYAYVLGAVQGIGAGLYWLAFNVVYFEVTGPDNRDRFNGGAGLLGSGAGMIAPWLSGWIIVSMTDNAGYMLIFSISLGVFLIGAIVSFFLRKRKLSGTYEWTHAFRNATVRGNPWRRAIPALVAQGAREGVFLFVIGLLVFIATNDEQKLGNFSLLTSGVALISFWLIGKWLKPHYRSATMLVGTVIMSLIIVPLFWEVSYPTLLLFGIVTSLFFPLFSIPMTSTVFDIIGRDQDSAEHRVEYVVFRELGLNAGRILGVLLFIVVVSQSTKPSVINSLLLAVGSMPILSWMFMRKVQGIKTKKT